MRNEDSRFFLVENELDINKSISKLLFLACLVGPFLFVLTHIGIFQIETRYCFGFTVFAIVAGAVQHLLTINPKYRTAARYFGIIAVEILIGISATKATMGVYISYCFGILLSCLYVNLTYTRIMCVFSYIVMIVAVYFRSMDLVAHHFIYESQMEYFIKYSAGFTIEFILLYFISQTIVEYEEKLLHGQEKELMERVEAQEENKAKSDFLAQMSHEIRTPINAVLGMNEMILRETNQPEIEGYAHTIKNAGKSLLTIVNDILDFSKIQSGKMDIVPIEYDCGAMLRDLVQLYSVQAVTKGLDFECQVAEDIPRILYGDEYRIKQACGNLISNAIKYTERGFVNLQVDAAKNQDNTITMHISVVDSGVGIKPEDIPKLFQNFGRLDLEKNRAIEGTGLGLKISKQLIEMMGGELGVLSVYGQGSNFSITLNQEIRSQEVIGDFESSLEKQEELDVGVRKNEQIITAPEAAILIVDDNDMNLQVASSLLKKSECLIECAHSGKECLECVKNRKYDLILLDHMMPEMDGIETLHALRDGNPDVDERTKIVALTANAILGAKEGYLQEGFDDYISKPIVVGELERVLLENIPSQKIIIKQSERKVYTQEVKEETPNKAALDLSEYGIDVTTGAKLLDFDMEVYAQMAEVFYHDYPVKENKMKDALNGNDLAGYAILVHGLKSNARTLGATYLGELAYEEEKQSKDGNIEFVKNHFPVLKQEWDKVCKGFLVLMEQYLYKTSEEQIEDSPGLTNNELEDRLLMILACLEEFQEKEAMAIIDECLGHSINMEIKQDLIKAKKALDQFDYEKTFALINQHIEQ